MGNSQVRVLQAENRLLTDKINKLKDLLSDEVIDAFTRTHGSDASVWAYVNWIRCNYNLLTI